MLCAAVAGIVIERLTRPSVNPSQTGGARLATPVETPDDPVSPASSTEQLISEAKQLADQLISTFPGDPAAVCLAGHIHRALGNAVRATECWQRCLQMKADFTDARVALGIAAWQQGDFQFSADYLREATNADPQRMDECLFCLADSLMNLGRAKEAIDTLEAAGRSRRLSPAGLVTLGQAWLQRKEFVKAREQFESALAAEPQLASAHYGLATALARLGELEQAEEHRRLYARWKQQDLARWDQLHGAGRKSEKVDPAQIRSLVAGFFLDAARLWQRHGRTTEADVLAERALAVDPHRAGIVRRE